MTQPLIGTDWTAGGFADIYKPFIERGGAQAVFVRQNRGADTDISPIKDDGITLGWSPFAQDNKLRDDLFIRRRNKTQWFYVTDPNEGFFHIGSQTEAGGAERTPNTSSDRLRVLQSPWTVDSVITEREYTVRFVAVQTADPLVQYLEHELPLVDDLGNPVVPLPGTPNYGVGPLLESPETEYQILLLYRRVTSAGPIYRVEGYPACKLDEQASKQRSKTDPDVADLTYSVEPSEHFIVPHPVTGEPVPGLFYVWMGGPGWAAHQSTGS